MCVGTEGHKGEQGEPGHGFLVLSLVTGTRNRLDSLMRLVCSIQSHTKVNWELIIADASDEPIPFVDEPGITILPERPRVGVSKGYNRAFAQAKGKYVLWLNDDAEVLPGYDVEAVRFMELNSNIGLGALYYQEGGSDFRVNSYLGMTYANFGIMKREFGNSIGWFDEEFPMYGSDNALAFRTLLADKGVAGIPNARLIHHAVADRHREENNLSVDRWHDVELLMAKYGDKIQYMRGIFRSMNPSATGYDHTPDSIARRFA